MKTDAQSGLRLGSAKAQPSFLDCARSQSIFRHEADRTPSRQQRGQYHQQARLECSILTDSRPEFIST